MDRPSGDQKGLSTGWSGGFVTWERPPPSDRRVHASYLPLRFEEKRIWRPSGDQRGARSRAGSLVNCRSSLPSDRTRNRSSCGEDERKTSHFRSGENSADQIERAPWKIRAGGPVVWPLAGSKGTCSTKLRLSLVA